MPGKISDYIVAGPLLGTELLDVSQVDGMSLTGYSTRSVTLNDIAAYVSSPTFYDVDGALASNRIVDQDGKYLIFDGGTYFQVDGTNDGLYYDFGLRRGGIGTEFPDVRWHIKAKPGEGGLLVEDSTGVDMLFQDANGKMYIRTTSGTDNLELRSTGGNSTYIKNNSNLLGIRSVGTLVNEGGNGAGAFIAINGFLSAANSYSNDDRTVEIGANYNSSVEISYLKFSSLSGIQNARLGSSDAENLRFDKFDIYSELSQFYGSVTIDRQLICNGLPTYADEAAAAGAGLASNNVYRTPTGELRIKL